MSSTLVVSSRGQITLPAATRKRLGIKGGDVVILEDRGGEIVLKPGVVLEIQSYGDEQIAQWDADDRLDEDERRRMLDALAGAEVRLFLDANVLFTAAHNPSGKAALTIELGKDGHWALTTSHYASEEARRNLERKFPRSRDDLSSLLRGIRLVEHRPELRFPAGLVERDRPIFQAAVACGANHLLTGDRKDFGPFMNRPEETFGIVVQTVADFLQSTLEQASPTRRRTARRASVPQPPSRGMSNTGWPPMPGGSEADLQQTERPQRVSEPTPGQHALPGPDRHRQRTREPESPS